MRNVRQVQRTYYLMLSLFWLAGSLAGSHRRADRPVPRG